MDDVFRGSGVDPFTDRLCTVRFRVFLLVACTPEEIKEPSSVLDRFAQTTWRRGSGHPERGGLLRFL